MILLWFATLIVLTVLMAVAWAAQRRLGNAGWVDVFWTFGTGAGAVLCALGSAGTPARRVMVAAMAAFWAVRLGGYIALRVAGSVREDVRYATFRAEWGVDFQRRMFRFVIVQGPIAAVLAGAAMLAARPRAPFPDVADVLGLMIFAAGLGIEAVADWQMRRFRALGHHGAVCDRGLWSISRHPNYVGEWVVWWAYPIIAIGSGGGWGWLALAAPAMMYWLLVYVSGIPPLEQAMLKSRGDAFRAYQRRVPAFLPGFPATGDTE